MLENDIMPRFMDFSYFEPMDEMLRLEEDRLSSYPQVPQLPKIEIDIVIAKKKKSVNHNGKNLVTLECKLCNDINNHGERSLERIWKQKNETISMTHRMCCV